MSVLPFAGVSWEYPRGWFQAPDEAAPVRTPLSEVVRETDVSVPTEVAVDPMRTAETMRYFCEKFNIRVCVR